MTGQTQSTDFAAGTLNGVSDAFVAKLTPSGELAWTTYLGGGTDEQGNGIAVTGDGAVVTGWTTSANFPTKTPLQGSRNGFRDAFVTKLTPAGALTWSTYLGGGDADDGNAVAVDPAGGVYLVGTTHSDNFPGTPAGSAAGGDDAFAAKVTGTTLAYATYLGGDGNDLGTAIAADAAGDAYVAGRAGDNFPSTLPYGGGGDAFAAKLGPTGARAYSTYLGGTTSDEAAGIAVTGAGVAVVVGTTQSADFPHTTGTLRGPSDAFVTRLTATGATDSSFFVGGSAGEGGSAVAIDKDGHVVIAGRTQSGDFPTVNPAQGTKGAGLDAFVTQLDGTTPLMSTYLGGSSGDEAHGVALDPGGNAYVAGRTEGSFPAGGTNPAGIDGFVAKLAIGSDSGPAPIVTPPPIPPAPQPAAPTPETTITARPPAQTPDQVVQFRFSGRMPGQIDPASGISFGCRLDGGDFKPCTSPYTTAKLALAEHTFAVRAVNASGVADPSPATLTFRVAQPRPEVRRYSCDLKPTGAHHDRGTRDWGPCDMPEIVCPREAVCLLDLAVDEHDDSYLFNYDVHLQRLEEGAYKDRVFCFAPPLSTPVNPKLEVRFDPRRGEHNRHHSCHADGALGLVDTSKDVRIRYRCSGSGHAPKPGGDRTTGEGHEDNAHLGCDITATIQRHVTELGDALVDGASPNLLIYTPQPGSVTVSGAKLATVTIKAAGGAVRVPLRLNAAAKKLRRKKALSAKLTITFKPADGATLTHTATVKLKRAAARRPARTRGAARRSAARPR